MKVSQIVCLSDLLRGTRKLPEALFDLVREPIRQGTGLRMGLPMGASNAGASSTQDFKANVFKSYAGVGRHNDPAQWAERLYDLPEKAVNYLMDALPADSLIVSVDLPPWLERACEARRIPYVDLRLSPLRFGRDLYVAVRASCRDLQERILPHTVLDEELWMEASLLAANVRMHQQGLQESGRYRFEGLQNALIILGHREASPALIADNGRFLRFDDFTERLARLAKHKRVIYKPHPTLETRAQEHREHLERLIGQPVHRCLQSTYQLLSSRDDLEFVAIASGVIQEAAWFDKPAHCLFRPFVPLANLSTAEERGYFQVHFETLLAPEFWHQMITPERQAPRMARLPAIAHHFARETTDQWSDYGKVKTWERSLPHQAFERLGGGLLRQRVEALESRIVETALPDIPPSVVQVLSPDLLRWERLSVQQIIEQSSSSAAATLFKQHVRMVEIEIFSFCNRKCWFCPNASVDRISKNTLMPPEMYSSILNQLASINYSGMITYSRYNEPLADKIILERLKEAKTLLPNALLHTNTNGDYLDTEYIEQLYEAGLRSLNIQIYLGNNERYDHEKIKAAGEKLLARVCLPATLTHDEPNHHYEFRLSYRDMSVRLYGRNFESSGTSRGGQVPIHLQHVRTSPCLVPFYAMYIDHDGSTVPCCNFRSDIAEHADYVIGNLKQQPDLFMQYAGKMASSFRRSLLNDQVKGGLCANCHYAEEVPTPAQHGQMAALQQQRLEVIECLTSSI